MQALGIVLFALAIGVSIMLHEAGHMLTAKRFGMKVTQYFVGFGPTLWSFRRGETEYGVKAIPAGGFVKIVGMTPQEKIDDPADEARAMWRRPIGQRTIVLVAGSVTHFVLAILLVYAAAVLVALPNPEFDRQRADILDGTTVGTTAPCFTSDGSPADSAQACTTADRPGPAAAGGLRVGDSIVSVGGVPTGEWSDVTSAIAAQTAGEPVEFVVDRDGATRTLSITPLAVPRLDVNGAVVPGETVAKVGISPPQPTAEPNVRYGPVEGVPATVAFMGRFVDGTFDAIARFPSKLPGLVEAVTGEERDPEGPISVVGASRIGGDALEIGGTTGVEAFLLILASLNLFIGVFNLFPLLPLDGGHIAVAWFEKVRSWWALKRGRPDPGRVDYNKLMPVTVVVIVVFGAVSLLAITADIVNPIRLL